MPVALTIKCPTAVVPYAKLGKPRGWPDEVPFIHPRTLSLEQLKKIQNNIDKIEFISMYMCVVIEFHLHLPPI